MNIFLCYFTMQNKITKCCGIKLKWNGLYYEWQIGGNEMKKPIQICEHCAATYEDCDCMEDDGTPIRWEHGGTREATS